MKDGVKAGNVLDFGEFFEADLQDGYGRGIVSAGKEWSARSSEQTQFEA